MGRSMTRAGATPFVACLLAGCITVTEQAVAYHQDQVHARIDRSGRLSPGEPGDEASQRVAEIKEPLPSESDGRCRAADFADLGRCVSAGDRVRVTFVDPRRKAIEGRIRELSGTEMVLDTGWRRTAQVLGADVKTVGRYPNQTWKAFGIGAAVGAGAGFAIARSLAHPDTPGAARCDADCTAYLTGLAGLVGGGAGWEIRRTVEEIVLSRTGEGTRYSMRGPDVRLSIGVLTGRGLSTGAFLTWRPRALFPGAAR